MFIKIPKEISNESLNQLCVDAGCKLPRRADEFCELDENVSISLLCDFAAKRGYYLGQTELGSLSFELIESLQEKLPPRLTNKQRKILKGRPTPLQSYIASKKEEASRIPISQDEIDCLLHQEIAERVSPPICEHGIPMNHYCEPCGRINNS